MTFAMIDVELFQLFHATAESKSESKNALSVEYVNLNDLPKGVMLSENNNLARACTEKGNMRW